jgi:D-sedoheptulose 7-phosphate isomerase
MTKQDFFVDYFHRFEQKLGSVASALLEQVCEQIAATGKQGNKLMVIGNGGSAGIASHVVLDCLNTTGLRAISFNQPELITCLANDYGYEHWVSKGLERYADTGDLVILISSSGQSPNMLNAARTAQELKLGLITLTGFRADNPLRQLGDINLWVDSDAYNIVEMVHHVWLLAIVDGLAVRQR